MGVQVVFRNIDATGALKEHAIKKVEKFRKFVTYPMDIHVLLSLQKTLQYAEITCHAEHKNLVATSKTKNMYEAIDLACHKIEAQLKKEREKKKGHNNAHAISRKTRRAGSDVEAEIPHRQKR